VRCIDDLSRRAILPQNDEIFVSKDSIHILKHHGSYMQQNRDIKKKADREQSYQFMLRLKVAICHSSSLACCASHTTPSFYADPHATLPRPARQSKPAIRVRPTSVSLLVHVPAPSLYDCMRIRPGAGG
jgi:hypothetical protein